MNTAIFHLGDRGPVVAEVRARLARLGLLSGSTYASEHAGDDPLRIGPKTDNPEPAEWHTTAMASAVFDDEIEQAVRVFQRQRGITEDGVVGPETYRRLEEARWRLGDRILSYAAAHPTVGEDVSELQSRLNSMGFQSGREEGHLGPLTDQAIREFQHNTGLAVDGVCGPATFRALGQLNRTTGKKSANAVREKQVLPSIRTGIRGKLVILDPAARNRLSGASDSDEAHIVSALAGRIEGQLTALGTQVMMTKSLSDTSGEVDAAADRAQFANETGADLVLSLSLCCDKRAPAGISTYFYGQHSGTHSVPGQLAASMIRDGIQARTDLAVRDSHGRTWDILRLTRMPAVRVECGNVAYSDDLARLQEDRFIDTLAQAIADSVAQFFAPEHVI